MRCENPIGEPFFELGEVDSSNNYAMRQVQAHLAVHGATWFAYYQNAGKGQRGKAWKAEAGQNLMMSSLIEPKGLGLDNQFILNAAVALACFDLFNRYAIADTRIKWPNDIYWRDRKAGGVLIENILKGSTWKHAIVGIGININQTLFPQELRNAVSLKQVTGQTLDVIALAKELCQKLETRWHQLKAKQTADLLNQYTSHLYKLNEQVVFKKENAEFTATIKGVNHKGELIIHTNRDIAVSGGSLEWVLT